MDGQGNLVEEEEGWETTAEEKRVLDEWFCHARPGDHLITPFQCELCHFRNVFKRDPNMSSEEDKWALKCIIRANLDAFWARRSSTVQGNTREMARSMGILSSLRISSPTSIHRRGPYPIEDVMGMIPAMISLQRSLDKGRNSKTIQWDTMRGVRSTFSNFIHTTISGTRGAVLSDGRRSTRITESVANSLWFKRFMDGCHERMGDVKIQDAAMSIELLLELEKLLDIQFQQLKEGKVDQSLFEIVTLGASLTLCFSSALRGEELAHIRLMETIAFTKQGLKHPRNPHILLALEGRFKGLIARQKHKIPLVLTTRSGIPNKKWLLRLFHAYEQSGARYGPLLRASPRSERAVSIQQLDLWLHEVLIECQKQHPELLGNDLESLATYSFRRSLRRGSTTQARNQKVPKDVVVLNNRWRSQEQARSRVAQSDMIDLYTDVVAALSTLLQYSEAL